MRFRSQVHTTPITGTLVTLDLVTNVSTTGPAWARAIVDSESLMWDDPAGTHHGFKPVTHLSYVVDSLNTGSHQIYNGTVGSNLPNPAIRYDDYPFDYDVIGGRPSDVLMDAENYVSVTGRTTDDLSNSVFNAYRQFISGITAMDASVSLAESGETPKLFEMWSRRRQLPSNLVNGFLAYSFGWKPLISDLRAISKEMRNFPVTVGKYIKSIGSGKTTRRYKFSLDDTIDSLDSVDEHTFFPPYGWSHVKRSCTTTDKKRDIVVTISAVVRPKLGPEGQLILNKLAATGLIPSLSTVWAVTRLSFVVDWFYNIGGAIDNLQGCLTHDISDVQVWLSDTRVRTFEYRAPDTTGFNSRHVATVTQRMYTRKRVQVPLFPQLTIPRRPVQYVLLGLLALVNTKVGRKTLTILDKTHLKAKFQTLRPFRALSRKLLAAERSALGHTSVSRNLEASVSRARNVFKRKPA